MSTSNVKKHEYTFELFIYLFIWEVRKNRKRKRQREGVGRERQREHLLVRCSNESQGWMCPRKLLWTQLSLPAREAATQLLETFLLAPRACSGAILVRNWIQVLWQRLWASWQLGWMPTPMHFKKQMLLCYQTCLFHSMSICAHFCFYPSK